MNYICMTIEGQGITLFANLLHKPNIFTRLPELLLLSTNKPQEISIPFNIAEAPANKLGGVKAAVCVPDKFLEIFGETAGENSVEDAVPGGFL